MATERGVYRAAQWFGMLLLAFVALAAGSAFSHYRAAEKRAVIQLRIDGLAERVDSLDRRLSLWEAYHHDLRERWREAGLSQCLPPLPKELDDVQP